MNELQTFNFEGKDIRTVIKDNQPWFVGKDVAEVLGYSNTRDALQKHVDVEDKDTVAFRDAIGREQTVTVINESGLYSLILKSQLPYAKRIKRWVTSEVLPSIRKHGTYMTEDVIAKTLSDPNYVIGLIHSIQEHKQKLEAQKPKVLFAESVETSNTSILIGDLAKLLRQNGVDIGRDRLFKILRNKGFLIRQGESYNMPTQKSMDLGVMEIKESTVINPDGSVRITKTPKITGKGQIYFINQYLGNKNNSQEIEGAI